MCVTSHSIKAAQAVCTQRDACADMYLKLGLDMSQLILQA